MHDNISIALRPQSDPAATANGVVPAWEHRPGHEPELTDRLPIQLKLSVGAVNDPLEHEADAMADKVMRAPETSLVQPEQSCSSCDYDDQHIHLKPLANQITPFIQAKSDSPGPVSDLVSGRINSTRGKGSAIDRDTKSFMESRFGADFSKVNIHYNDESAQLSTALNAKAFTVSNDIYFNSSQYQPETSTGRHLLAHELTHTIQQSGSKRADNATTIRRSPESDAKALSQKLHDALTAAKVDEPAVLTLLGSLGRDPAKAALLKTSYKTNFTTELDADIKQKISAANVNRALFLLNAPPAATYFTLVDADNPGTEDHNAKVGGGVVSVHTGVDYRQKVPTGQPKNPLSVDGFSIGYQGDKASESHYIQTIWSEVISTQKDNTKTKVAKSGVPSIIGSMDLTTDLKNINYKIDAAGKDSPFYDNGGLHNRKDDSITDFDRPADDKGVIGEQFDAGAIQVDEIEHFDDFLIQEEKAIYQVSLTVQFTYNSKTDVPSKANGKRVTKFISGAAIKGLPAEVKRQLVKEYPRFEYIR